MDCVEEVKCMLSVVQSLHNGMLAEVTVNGQMAPEFEGQGRLCDIIYPVLCIGDRGWRERVCVEQMLSTSMGGRRGGGELVDKRTRGFEGECNRIP